MNEKNIKTGWTRAENAWLDDVITRELPGSELRVLLCVLRQTAGYNRDSAELSVAAFARMCSMSARSVHRALDALTKAQLIVREKKGARGCSVVFLARSTDDKTVSSTSDKTVSSTSDKTVSSTSDKTDNVSLDKESIKKDTLTPLIFFELSKGYHNGIKKAHPGLTAGLTEKSDRAGAEVLEKLARIDGHDIAHIKKVLDWALTDKFWSVNLRSLASARNKSKNGSTKFENCAAQYELANPAPAATGADRHGGCSIYGHMTDAEMRAYAERIRPGDKAGGKNAGKSWQGL